MLTKWYQKGFYLRKNKVALVVSALKGGSGKTFISVGLASHFKNKHLKVVSFKKGPDYIDAGWLSIASGNPCYNLDQFLMAPEDIVASFEKHSFEADVALVEGNRGLFDGLNERGSCSTAELAKILDLPIILILDVTKMTRTSAALVYGCQHFDKNVRIAGVILNQVGTARQERLIRKSIENYCSIPVIGAIPRLPENLFPERHLGLIPIQEHGRLVDSINQAREIVERYIDLEALESVLKQDKRFQNAPFYFVPTEEPSVPDFKCSIGVIRDEAFQFYYPENLEALERLGARLVFLSALRDSKLPEEIDGLYIGGGFPETHVKELVENKAFRESVRGFVEAGLPVYAECGGFMYLSEYILIDGISYPMVGVFPLTVVMSKKPQGHGYVVGEVVEVNPFYPVGSIIKGHEFHYSSVPKWPEHKFSFALKLHKGKGILEHFDGIIYKNTAAFYTHVHALGCKFWAEGFVGAACSYKYGTKLGSFETKKIPVIYVET